MWKLSLKTIMGSMGGQKRCCNIRSRKNCEGFLFQVYLGSHPSPMPNKNDNEVGK